MNNYYKDIEQLTKNKYDEDNRDYLKLIKAGNIAQMEKLKENKHKPGFDKLTFEYVYNRLVEEMVELKEAFEADVSNKGLRDIRKEAADVANFAHMLIYKCDQELTFKQKRGKKAP